MNPSSHTLRLNGEQLDYVKTNMMHGKVEHQYKDRSGNIISIKPPRYPSAAPRGTHTRSPLRLVGFLLAALFH